MKIRKQHRAPHLHLMSLGVIRVTKSAEANMDFFYSLGAFLGVTGGCWAAFNNFESVAPEETKTLVSSWVRGKFPIRVDEKWPSTFISLFDRLFGTRFLSLRFGLVSVILSIACVALLFMFWCMFHPTEVSFYFSVNPIGTAVLFGGTFIVTNLFTDYLSNCQTRYVLGRLVDSLETNAHRPPFYTYSKWLIADLLLTVSLSAAIVVPISIFVPNAIASAVLFDTAEIQKPFDVGRMLSLHATEIRIDVMDSSYWYPIYTPPFGMFFYTTVFTSTWLWMYAISGACVRMISRLLGPNAFIFRIFDFDNHPVRSLGGVSSLLLGASFLVCMAISS